MPPVGFEPTISAGERPAAAPLKRALKNPTTSAVNTYIIKTKNKKINKKEK